MSANFTLSVSNPAVKSGEQNVAYTGQANTLAVQIDNEFGSALTFGAGSTGTYLFIGVSQNVMDDAGAKLFTVDGPWTVASYDPPGGNTPIGQGNYVFYLKPPAAGVQLPEGKSVPVTLTNVQPFATGVGQIAAYYDFDGISSDALNATTPLSVFSPSKGADLFGEEALAFSYSVNGGGDSNPIMVSATPVTQQNAVDNTIHLNFVFQGAQPFAISGGKDGSSGLIPGWSGTPPTFRVWFAYSGPNSGLPAPLDLTDCLQSTDPQYNPLTSAWNIPVSLNATDPNIRDNGYWRISLDSTVTAMPVWMIQPDTTNQHLFTATQTSPSEPGPFLDTFALNVVSALPIDQNEPQTLMYLQWNDFPGFSDGVAVYTLQKTPLTISSFTVAVVRTHLNVELKAQWQTSGVSCEFSATSGSQNPTSTYTAPITAEAPLQSSYTLTAINGKASVSKTVSIQWQINTALTPVAIDSAVRVEVTPDGTQVLVLGSQSGNLGIQTFSPTTLALQPNAMVGTEVIDFAIAPDNSAAYYNNMDGTIAGITVGARLPVPGSGTNDAAGSTPPFPLGLSPDSTKVVMSTSQSTWESGGHTYTFGANQLVVLNSGNLTNITGSPFALQYPTIAMVVGPQTGRCYLGQEYISVLDGTTYQPVQNSPINAEGTLLLAISLDETSLYSVGLDLTNKSFYLAKSDANSLQVTYQMLNGYGPFLLFEVFLGIPLAALSVSIDGGLLFFIGISMLSQEGDNPIVSRFSVYNTATMEEVNWSPLSFGAFVPLDLAMSPDGTRLFVLASLNPTAQDATVSLYAVDPVFS